MWVILQKARSENAPYLITLILPMEEAEAKRKAETLAKNNPSSLFITAELKEEFGAIINVERKALV